MSSSAPSFVPSAPRAARLEVLFEELAELAGQRNAIDGRIVEIAAEIERDELCGMTGARSVAALMAWKTGSSSRNGKTIAAVAHRLAEFPRCAAGLREGRLSLDQVGVIAEGAGAGSDEHYAELAAHASVSQLRTAVKLAPRPDPEPVPGPDSGADAESGPAPVPHTEVTKTSDEQYTYWRIALPHLEAATFDAPLQSHHEALIAQWKRDHDTTDDDFGDGPADDRPPMPTLADAFTALVEAGWDAEATRRPHGHRTTVVVHVDLADRVAALHLGPLLCDADRRYLGCDATCEVWFRRDGQVIGAGRATRLINRRLRRALEHRDRTCVVPGCGATRGLHAHHIIHWEDGGPTDLDNLVLVCPYHHRLHHRRVITITGPAHRLTVTDHTGRPLRSGSSARPPNHPHQRSGPTADPVANAPTGGTTNLRAPTTSDELNRSSMLPSGAGG